MLMEIKIKRLSLTVMLMYKEPDKVSNNKSITNTDRSEFKSQNFQFSKTNMTVSKLS